MRGILSDICVTAFTHFAAGPLTAQYIGAFGADVIKNEEIDRLIGSGAVLEQTET